MRELIRRWLGIGESISQADFIAYQEGQQQLMTALQSQLTDFKDALKRRAEASRTFDGDNMQPVRSTRYVPIARLRAMAEAQSAGPATHKEQVRENNARAIESAG